MLCPCFTVIILTVLIFFNLLFQFKLKNFCITSICRKFSPLLQSFIIQYYFFPFIQLTNIKAKIFVFIELVLKVLCFYLKEWCCLTRMHFFVTWDELPNELLTHFFYIISNSLSFKYDLKFCYYFRKLFFDATFRFL